MPKGVPISFTQIMLFAGAETIRNSKLLKDTASEQDFMRLATMVYRAMEYAREDILKKDLLILGER